MVAVVAAAAIFQVFCYILYFFDIASLSGSWIRLKNVLILNISLASTVACVSLLLGCGGCRSFGC